ncbi:MAG: DUF4159 domain-containing protein [Bacteroidetes bacterium]|nr:DUF4159 domain-containing protein [Bacteroidota bacterium]
MTVCNVKQIGCADVCPIPNTHGPIKRLFPVVFARQAPVQKSHVKRSLIFPAAVVFGILWVATPIALHAQDQHAFKIARIKYGGGGDWYGDPESLKELLKFANKESLLDIAPQEDVVELSSDKIYSYPYVYLTGHGNVKFSETEGARLRRYLLNGGFLHIDDNYGLDQHIRRELSIIFPDRELRELPFDHPIFHTHYDFPAGLPKIHEHDGKRPQGFGLFDDDGRLMLFYTYECDLGDGWEPEEVHHDPPEKRLAALRMGTNILTYAMTN